MAKGDSYVEIPASSVDAQSPVDELLMDGTEVAGGYNNNLINHENRILALEAGGGGGAATSGQIAEITLGCFDNTAKMWRKRFDIFKEGLKLNLDFIKDRDVNITGVDGNSNRLAVVPDNQTGDGRSTSTDRFQTNDYDLSKSNKLSFRLKQGENFFGLITSESATSSDSVTVTVDGVAVNTLGLTDHEGTAVSATFSTTTGTTLYQSPFYFFGLTPDKERTITIENTDSASKVFALSGIEVGYFTPDAIVAIDENDVRLSAGRASVRGQSVEIEETDLTFSAPSGYGRTDIVAATTAGVVSVLEGVSPAMTQLRSTTDLDSSSSTMEVKNHYYFPAQGFVDVGHPFGLHYSASYNAKSNGTYGSFDQQTLDGVLWSGKFETVSSVNDNLQSAGGGFVPDVVVNLIGTGGLEVDTTNNKIDFKIKADGDVTAQTYAATVASGLYSADVIPLGQAILDALYAAKALPDGSYFCDWNEETQKWSIGISGTASATEFELLFSTGTNVATSIHTDLGFGSTDLSGELSYVATTPTQHKCVRCQEAMAFEHPDSPNIKFDDTEWRTDYQDLLDREQYRQVIESGFKPFGYIPGSVVTGGAGTIKMYTDPDATGAVFYFMRSYDNSVISCRIDNGQQIYPMQYDSANTGGGGGTASIIPFYVSFPRGSKFIELNTYVDTDFRMDTTSTSTVVFFLGARQLKSRAPFEKLTLSQAALKQFDIAPLRLVKNLYNNDFVVGGSNDNIDAITYTGSWGYAASTTAYNGDRQNTSTLNDNVDVQFTLSGSGGGVYIMGVESSGSTNEVEWYVNAAAAASSAATKLIQKNKMSRHTAKNNVGVFELTGLPAGTYTLRGINKQSAAFTVVAIGVIDTLDPDENAVVVSESANNLMAVGYPMAVTRLAICRDGTFQVPIRMESGQYRKGSAVVHYRVDDHSLFTDDDETSVISTANHWFGQQGGSNDVNANFGTFFHGRSVHTWDNTNTGRSPTNTPVIDARTDASYSDRVNTKAGSAPTSGSGEYNGVQFRKYYERDLSSDMSSSTVCPLNDTRGIRVGQSVKITADGQADEIRRVASVSADTSITLNTAIAGYTNYTTANNARVIFHGFHAIRINVDSTSNKLMSAFCYEPMPVVEKATYNDVAQESPQRWNSQKLSYALSDEIVSFSSGTGSYADVTNSDLTIESHGNPIFLTVVPTSTASGGQFLTSTAASGTAEMRIRLKRNGSVNTNSDSSVRVSVGGGTSSSITVPGGSYMFIDFVPAGVYEYILQVSDASADSAQVGNAKLLAIELPFDFNSFDFNPYDLIKELT